MSRILAVDDEASLLEVLATLFKAEGYDVVTQSDPEKARDLLLDTGEVFDLMLCDMRMNPIDGMQLLEIARNNRPEMAVVMLTAYGSVETAIKAMQLGAFDYVTKPFKVNELLITIQRALEYRKALEENVSLRAQLETRYQFENIVAESESMKNVCDMIKRVGPTDSAVLISGDSGTGKELVARAIHVTGSRKESKFIAVNCAALPEPLLESEMFGHVKGAFTGATADKEGLFEAADEGTLFLDEVESMPPSIQSKLLRALQNKTIRRVGSNDDTEVDVRILAATNYDLENLIAQGKFREDLFYRLSVIHINIKPLRERREDILPLAYHVIRQETPESQTPPTIEAETCAILESYDWPGNVRELENSIKHALTFAKGDEITKEVLPPKIASVTPDEKAQELPTGKSDEETGKGKSLRDFLRRKEREYLQSVLDSTGGNKEKAAEVLRISLATLYRKLGDDDDKK